MPSRRKKDSAKAASSSEQVSAIGDISDDVPPNPNWVDLEHLPGSAEHYIYFSPPRRFRDCMLQDRQRWAPDVQPHVILAITNAVSNICMPWWVDWSTWRRHASDFFDRLCAHRRRIHEEIHGHREDLCRRLSTLEGRLESAVRDLCGQIDSLEGRLDAFERTLGRVVTDQAAATQAFSPAPSIDRGTRPARGRSPFPDEPVEEAVLRAQMAAAAARSPSPSISLLRDLHR